jgi:hypothetical protein
MSRRGRRSGYSRPRSGSRFDASALQLELQKDIQERQKVHPSRPADPKPQPAVMAQPVSNFCGSFSCGLPPSLCYSTHGKREPAHRCASGQCGDTALACEGSFIVRYQKQAPAKKCNWCGEERCSSDPNECKARLPGLHYA